MTTVGKGGDVSLNAFPMVLSHFSLLLHSPSLFFSASSCPLPVLFRPLYEKFRVRMHTEGRACCSIAAIAMLLHTFVSYLKKKKYWGVWAVRGAEKEKKK